MAIIIETKNAEVLFDQFICLVKSGIIKTWITDEDDDLTSSNQKWRYKAWFTHSFDHNNTTLAFGIMRSYGQLLTNEIYGVYHGRLVSTLVAHFDYLIDGLRVTPMIDPTYDII